VFTARYALSPYIKQIRFVFKGLIKHKASKVQGNGGILNLSTAGSQLHALTAILPEKQPPFSTGQEPVGSCVEAIETQFIGHPGRNLVTMILLLFTKMKKYSTGSFYIYTFVLVDRQIDINVFNLFYQLNHIIRYI
jgi:hypothetical protein